MPGLRVLPLGRRPAKVTEGCAHPDPIVETLSLASVIPPEATYQHHLQVLPPPTPSPLQPACGASQALRLVQSAGEAHVLLGS